MKSPQILKSYYRLTGTACFVLEADLTDTHIVMGVIDVGIGSNRVAALPYKTILNLLMVLKSK